MKEERSHDTTDFSLQLDRFEQAWQGGSPPHIADFLSGDLGEASRRKALIEFVIVDLECRWKLAAGLQTAANSPNKTQLLGSLPSRPLLEVYLRHYPELSNVAELPLELISEEYRVRRRCSDQPSHAEYLKRFPTQAELLSAALSVIDKEIDSVTPVPSETIQAPSEGRGSGGLHVRCPHCHNSIELVPDAPLEDISV